MHSGGGLRRHGARDILLRHRRRQRSLDTCDGPLNVRHRLRMCLLGRHRLAEKASDLLWLYGLRERLRGWCHGSRGFGLSSQRHWLTSGLHHCALRKCLVNLWMLEGFRLLLKSRGRAFHCGSEGLPGRDFWPGLSLAQVTRLASFLLLRVQRGVMIIRPARRAWN